MIDMLENADTMKKFTGAEPGTTYKKMLGLADLRKILSDEPEEEGGLKKWKRKIFDRN